jgi:hypothetical protein
MSKYPKFRLSGPPDWQTRRLKAWIDEWTRETKLRLADPRLVEGEVDSGFRRGSEPGSATAPFDPDVCVGQIRLLSPKLIPDCPRFLYFAVVADWAEGMKLISPFSNFSEPASPGELHTGRSDFALRVLCLWNSHTLPSELLAHSWIVDRMTESEVDAAWAVFESATLGKPLPAELVQRVGPPISHPRDPRRQYQEEEVRLMSPLRQKAISWAEDHGLPSNVIQLRELAELAAQHEMALAAAEVSGSIAERIFWTQNKQTKVIVRLQGKTYSISVWDAVGEPSNQLDGCVLIGPEGQQIARISNGVARVPAEPQLRLKNDVGDDVLIVPEA